MLLGLFGILSTCYGQNSEGKKLPAIVLKDLAGADVDVSKLSADGRPVFLTFWATWCKPCINELMAVSEELEDWVKETNVRVVAVSIDDARSKARVPSMVNGKGWEFDVLIDENSDLKRALNVTNPPHSFIMDKDGNIVWQHNGYQPGNEEEYIDILRKVAKGEPLK
ncbi:MAG: TlpA family protein disulfide reductase [Cytophagales bacterium]|nr:MAG: TlpA family protein disulfide reductase [Cytophagales bacterium]TAF61019.1 MAG: TlpA family protein disulfide reductase [Cytophagales bacterium]